jgi:ribonuclease BN (tRNA processing enzyme)
MAVQILGSSDPFVNAERASTSYLVRFDGTARVMIDVGGGAFLRFGEAHARLADLWLIAISHLHPDHVSDLPALLWLSNVVRQEPLPIVGPDGNDTVPSVSTFLTRLFDQRDGAFPMLSGTLGGTGRGVRLEVTVADAAKADATRVFDKNGIEVMAIGVPHATTPSLAYRVKSARGTIVFGSDQSGDNPRFIEFARDADILILHMAIGVGQRVAGHASSDVIGRVAAEAKPKRLVLSHIGQFDVKAAVSEVRKHYTGPIDVGADLACIAVR